MRRLLSIKFQRKVEEKNQKREQRLIQKKLNEMKLLKQTIDEELIKQAEVVDEVTDVYNVNGYHQKAKKYGKEFI